MKSGIWIRKEDFDRVDTVGVNVYLYRGDPAGVDWVELAPVSQERERINLLLTEIRKHWVASNGEDSITVGALDQIAEVIADGSHVNTAAKAGEQQQ